MTLKRILALAGVLVFVAGCYPQSSVAPDNGNLSVTAVSPQAAGVRASAPHFVATLSGGPDGTDSRARGVATLQLAPDGQSMSYRLIVSNIMDVTMAHIHISAEPGGDGPPAVWLYPDAPPAQPIAGRHDGVLAEGTITAANFIGPLDGMTMSDLVSMIRDGRAYVNVHTEANPGGEIRGQLE